jgi:hypothetical protein
MGQERVVLAWFPHPADQALVAGSNWAGEVRQDPGDYLYAVDANLAPSSKLSLVVQRSTDLQVTLDGEGNASHLLRLEWRNDALTPGEPYETLLAASDSEVGAYGDYPRVLVPGNADLIEAIGQSALEVSGAEMFEEEAGRMAIGNYLMILPGTAWVRYEYVTPVIVESTGDEHVYRLTVQKQPAMGDEPIEVTVQVPGGASIVSTSAGMTTDGTTAAFEGVLTTDLQLEVRYTQ